MSVRPPVMLSCSLSHGKVIPYRLPQAESQSQVFPPPLSVLTVWRAQHHPTTLPKAVAMNLPASLRLPNFRPSRCSSSPRARRCRRRPRPAPTRAAAEVASAELYMWQLCLAQHVITSCWGQSHRILDLGEVDRPTVRVAIDVARVIGNCRGPAAKACQVVQVQLCK